jgi:hypothetical protein
MAPAPDQPLPPLIKIDINKRTRKHITQEMTDCILQIASERQPDLWLAFSEEDRHKVLLDGTVQVPRVAQAGPGRGTSGSEQYVAGDVSLTRSSRAHLSHVRAPAVPIRAPEATHPV